VKRAPSFRGVAKSAGLILIGLVALDIVATLITVAVGAEVLKR
jgi:hypothetical protein